MREGIECGKDEAALSHIRKLLGKNRTDAALPPVFGEGGYIAHAAAEHDVAVEENVIDIVDHVRRHHAVFIERTPKLLRTLGLPQLFFRLRRSLFRIHRAHESDG